MFCESSVADEAAASDSTSSTYSQSVSCRSTLSDSFPSSVLQRGLDAEHLHRLLSTRRSFHLLAVRMPPYAAGGRAFPATEAAEAVTAGCRPSTGDWPDCGHLPRGCATRNGRARENSDVYVDKDGCTRDRRQPDVVQSNPD